MFFTFVKNLVLCVRTQDFIILDSDVAFGLIVYDAGER